MAATYHDYNKVVQSLRLCFILIFLLKYEMFCTFCIILHKSVDNFTFWSSSCVYLSVEPFRFQAVFHYLGYLTAAIYNK